MTVQVKLNQESVEMSSSSSSQTGSSGGQKVELVRNLRFMNCVSLLIAIIIGTGIFISPKVWLASSLLGAGKTPVAHELSSLSRA